MPLSNNYRTTSLQNGHKNAKSLLTPTSSVDSGEKPPAKSPRGGGPNSSNGSNNDYDLVDQTMVDFLESGGDDRLVLKNGVNKYFVPPRPVPEAIHRGSCTSSCTTSYSYEKGRKLVADLLKDANNTSGDSGSKYREILLSVRSQLYKYWGLDKRTTSMTLCPSGSDAEFVPALLALLRVLKEAEENGGDYGAGVLSIVTGAGEVGSGTALAAGARHFSNLAPKIGMKIKTGEPVRLGREGRGCR